VAIVVRQATLAAAATEAARVLLQATVGAAVVRTALPATVAAVTVEVTAVVVAVAEDIHRAVVEAVAIRPAGIIKQLGSRRSRHGRIVS